jgi:predicted dehydrogenase
MVIEASKKYDVRTHLLAWEEKPSYHLIKKWIDEGVIGTLKEIHNWSYRPVWPQYLGVPKDRPSVPEGFNWDLWLGPEKDRPYHPYYTHNVFRGWFDFGGGSIADMGHYSLFPLFRILGVDTAPKTIKAYGSVYRTTINQVCRGMSHTDAFPYSSTYKFSFPDQNRLGSFDLYWYDGGIKPFAPEELEVDGRDIPQEGLLFIGDKGKILAGFQGANPEMLPKKKMDAYVGEKTLPEYKTERPSDTWVRAIKSGEESAGSFRHAGPITDLVNLGAAALRSRKKLEFDSDYMRITNDEDANKYLYRDYREGWEMEV